MCDPTTAPYQRYYYIGKSMKGTFWPADTLLVSPVEPGQLRAGDVVIFRDADLEYPVVHRVVKIVPGGLIAKGDSNFWGDLDVVLNEDVIGKVVYRFRQSKLRPVIGGLPGSLRGHLLQTRWHISWRLNRAVWYMFYPLARRAYRWVRKSGVVPRLWRPTILTIHVVTDKGPLIKYVYRNRTIAKWWPETNRFYCRRPFDLVLIPPIRDLWL